MRKGENLTDDRQIFYFPSPRGCNPTKFIPLTEENTNNATSAWHCFQASFNC